MNTSPEQGGVRREKLEISPQAFERRFLVDAGLPDSKPNITAPAPPSALLSRLQQFLPAMQLANQQLQEAPASEALLEQQEDVEGPCVELDLACGLFDLKDEAAVGAAERSLVETGVAIERFGEGASSSSDDSSDESSDEELEGGVAPMEAEASVQGAAVQKKGGGGGKGHGTHLAPAAGARVGRRRVKVVKNKKRRAGIEVIG